MNHKLLAVVLIVLFNALAIPLLAQAADSIEDQCIKELVVQMGDNDIFGNIDMSGVTKISGPAGYEVESARFPLNDHNRFIEAVNTPVPKLLDALPRYPNDIGGLRDRYLTTPKIYRAGRNNSGAVVLSSGGDADIGLKIKGVEQKIRGYYLDNRYVTFGRQSAFGFYFPSRDPNPGRDSYFPQGAPIEDMREYLMYTQHLSPERGGDFVGCGVIKVTPQSGFSLTEAPGKTPIRWEYYGSTRTEETDVNTEVVRGGKFRKAFIRFTINQRQDPTKRLLRFHTLSLSYNNNSDFFNEFETVRVFEENANQAGNTALPFLEFRSRYYQRLQTDPVTKDLIIIGGSGSGGNAGASAAAEAACAGIGASLYQAGGEAFCRVQGDSCPAGWSQYENYTATERSKCGSVNCAACTTRNHFFANAAPETCRYAAQYDGRSSCSGADLTCRAAITEIGCAIPQSVLYPPTSCTLGFSPTSVRTGVASRLALNVWGAPNGPATVTYLGAMNPGTRSVSQSRAGTYTYQAVINAGQPNQAVCSASLRVTNPPAPVEPPLPAPGACTRASCCPASSCQWVTGRDDSRCECTYTSSTCASVGGTWSSGGRGDGPFCYMPDNSR